MCVQSEKTDPQIRPAALSIGREIDSSNTGAETQKRYRYQNAYGVILLVEALCKKNPYVAIWYEHYEDLLAERADGFIDVYQVKTRQGGGRWNISDKKLRESIKHFVELDQKFPRQVSSFSFVSNLGYAQGSARNREKFSPLKFLDAIRGVTSHLDLMPPFASMFEALRTYCDCDAASLLTTLKKLRFDLGPELSSFEDIIAYNYLPSLPGCDSLSTSALRELFDEIMAPVASAASVSTAFPSYYRFGIHRGAYRDRILEAKRISTKMFAGNLKKHLVHLSVPLIDSRTLQESIVHYYECVEKMLRYHNLNGIPLKGDIKRAPELKTFFVPLRFSAQTPPGFRMPEEIISLLEQFSRLVLLGEPGSGKSILLQYLAWSHASAHVSQARNAGMKKASVLSGKPVPLLIDLGGLARLRRRQTCSFMSYVTNVVLGHRGIVVDPQMFTNLLERGSVLALFDGLDEVPTPYERQQIVNEIGCFVQLYPKNRVVVTSRPVGYTIASLPGNWFTHCRLEKFSDQQIHTFLRGWYESVLGHSPLPAQKLRELEDLYALLTEDVRLHSLARNPLLLAVLADLNRFGHLPTRRTQIYDQCADLLLNTWIERRKSNNDWKEMKMGKTDQYACVAHLGFALHSRERKEKSAETHLQGDDDRDWSESPSGEVPERFFLLEVRRFIRDYAPLLSVAEQNAEADRFLELIQQGIGLIVERGSDEMGNTLYGFIHRTFQEYFAAMDIYEQYQRKNDPLVIQRFLIDCLHDPHWYEVILLLFEKLEREVATDQLRLLLDSQAQGRWGGYNDILRLDHFFACDLLLKGIDFREELAERIIVDTCRIVERSPFSQQQQEAWNVLALLLNVPQYAYLVEKELAKLLTGDSLHPMSVKMRAARILYEENLPDSQERREAAEVFLGVAQSPTILLEQRIEAAATLYRISTLDSTEKQNAESILLSFSQRPDLSTHQATWLAQELYEHSPADSQPRRLANQLLQRLVLQPQTSLEHALHTIQRVYDGYAYIVFSRVMKGEGERNREHKRLAQAALSAVQRFDTSFEQALSAIKRLYEIIRTFSPEGQHPASSLLIELSQRPALCVEQKVQVALALYESNWSRPHQQQQGIHMLLALARQPSLSFEQMLQVAQLLCHCIDGYDARQKCFRFRDTLLEAKPPVYHSMYEKEKQEALLVIASLSQRFNLSVEQRMYAAQLLCKYSDDEESDEVYQEAEQALWRIVHEQSVSFGHTLRAAQDLSKTVFDVGDGTTITRHSPLGVHILQDILARDDISLEQTIQAATALYRCSLDESQERDQAICLLWDVLHKSSLSNTQTIEVTTLLINNKSNKLHEADYRYLTQLCIDLILHGDRPFNEKIQLARMLYWRDQRRSEQRKEVFQVLLSLSQQLALPFEQCFKVLEECYYSSLPQSEERHQVSETLWQLAGEIQSSEEQRLQVAALLLEAEDASYADRMVAVRAVLAILQGDAAKQYLTEHWQPLYLFSSRKLEAQDISYMAELARNDKLPLKIRNEMYNAMHEAIEKLV